MNNQDVPINQPPVIRPVSQLPEFVQMCVDKIWKEYGIPKNKTHIMFTFHDAIYTLNTMPQDWYVHECVHFVRQGSGKDLELAKQWWSRYATEPAFRLEEELLAYKEQYQFITRRANKSVAFEHAKSLAQTLSSPMYGNLINFQRALSGIMGK